MNYLISILIIAFLGIMIFTNTKSIIEKVKQKKQKKVENNSENAELNNDNKEVKE